MHALTEFFQTCFMWPVLPATILVGLVLLYWLMVIFSGIGVDMIELDFDFPEGSVLDLGFAPFRFLNLGTVPLMLWMPRISLSPLCVPRVHIGRKLEPED